VAEAAGKAVLPAETIPLAEMVPERGEMVPAGGDASEAKKSVPVAG